MSATVVLISLTARQALDDVVLGSAGLIKQAEEDRRLWRLIEGGARRENGLHPMLMVVI